jgi:hypothetical protein
VLDPVIPEVCEHVEMVIVNSDRDYLDPVPQQLVGQRISSDATLLSIQVDDLTLK